MRLRTYRPTMLSALCCAMLRYAVLCCMHIGADVSSERQIVLIVFNGLANYIVSEWIVLYR